MENEKVEFNVKDVEKMSSKKLRVLSHTDNSGDYETITYSVQSVHDWGTRTIAEGIDNPYDAILFAASPQIVEELEKYKKQNERLKKVIREIKETTQNVIASFDFEEVS